MSTVVLCVRALCRWASLPLLALSLATGCGANQQADGDGPLFINRQSEAQSSLSNGMASLPMTGCAAFDYFAQVNVGGQPLNLLMDSGSATLAVATTSCSTCSPAVDYQLSNTGRRLGARAQSYYLDGSGWGGVTYSDEVAIGSATVLATPAVNLQFAGIVSQSSFFEDVDVCEPNTRISFDGILGLGPDAQLVSGTTSFLTALAGSQQLKADAFALHLCDIGGTMFVGGYDPSHTTGSPNYTLLTSTSSSADATGAYSIEVAQMSLGGVDFGLSSASLGPTVIDNGTGAVVLPSEAYNAFVQILERNQTYLDNFGQGFISGQNGACAMAAKGLTRAQLDAALPMLAYTFPAVGGGTFQVELPATSSYLVAGTVINRQGQPTEYCPAVMNGKTNALLGNTAMRQHVVIFDRENGRIGFAPQTGCTASNMSFYDGT